MWAVAHRRIIDCELTVTDCCATGNADFWSDLVYRPPVRPPAELRTHGWVATTAKIY